MGPYAVTWQRTVFLFFHSQNISGAYTATCQLIYPTFPGYFQTGRGGGEGFTAG